MKKLYFLDESEKERILSLHESHTKKQYLMNEQSVGTAIWDMSKGLVLGGIAGAGIALYNNIRSANTRAEFNSVIAKACSKQGKPMMTVSQHMNIAEKLNGFILTPNWPSGYATKDSRAGIKSTLESISSIPDLCAVIKEYKNLYTKDLMNELGIEFYSDQNWQSTVKTPLTKAIRVSEEAAAKAKEQAAQKPAETLVGWEKYPCVTTNPNAKKFSLKDGSVTYEINGFYYYGGGRKMNMSTREMSDYHCGADGLIKEGPKPAGGSTAAVTTTGGGGGGLGTRITTIQKQLGLTQSGTMDQATINALITKIQGGSGSTTNTATTPQAKGLE